MSQPKFLADHDLNVWLASEAEEWENQVYFLPLG